MIDLEQVTKVFNKGNANECIAVDDISLTIDAHKITVLTGPSGSGKTTALSIIGAMTKPTSGRVRIFGDEITSLPERFLSRIRRRSFGFIFQQFNLIKGVTALENVMIPAYPSGEKHRILRSRALDLLDLFNLSHKATSRIEWLSGGEAQRITIARALMNNPEIIIADEPTAHLDTKLSTEFMEIMARLNGEGKTILIASHDPLVYGSPVVERLIEFRDGRITAPGCAAMILHPAVLALCAGSLVVTFMVLSAAFYGMKILRHWDLKSGSELQLNLERQTYLISTIMSYAFGFQLFSLFLFIFTADTLAGLFTGAMCAAGTLNVNGFGYPALLFKIINFILGGVWLIVNYTDNRAIDYPLIKKKYAFLLVVAPFILVEMVLQGAYFLNLDAHVITSCCGSLFSPEGEGIGAFFVSTLPTVPMKIVFYAAMILTGASGFLFYRQGRPATGYFFALMSVITFLVSVAALIAFISLYFYQLPTHHCPFCILQKEYYYVGYLLYITLLGGVVCGASTGALLLARSVTSLREFLPEIEKRLALATVVFYLLFTVIVTCMMIFTNFKLEGY